MGGVEGGVCGFTQQFTNPEDTANANVCPSFANAKAQSSIHWLGIRHEMKKFSQILTGYMINVNSDAAGPGGVCWWEGTGPCMMNFARFDDR